jgi:hypothetical protein
MNASDHAALQVALGAKWLVSGRTCPPPGRMRLFDFSRTLYVTEAKGKPYRWVLWDGLGDLFGGGSAFDVDMMAANLRVFVGEDPP